jgi:HK97 family phage portal protein
MKTKRQPSASWLASLAQTIFPKQKSTTVSKQYGYTNWQTYMQQPGKPVWMSREYGKFADEAYIKNVIAYRSIHTIASGAASIDWKLLEQLPTGEKRVLAAHPLLKLLSNPNPFQGGAELFEAVLSYRLISGNSYLQSVGPEGGPPRELYTLRPDRMAVIPGSNGVPLAYRYSVRDAQGRETYRDFQVNRINGKSAILHLKTFHPLDDWYGLSPIDAAAYSIDQHNQSGAWNQALLQNGARPSGALVVKSENNTTLSEEQYHRLKVQIDEQFSGPQNAGRPVLLEGGLDWREMSLSPKDMDYINAKHSSARDIALAFGVPPQLLGIPGDNTYANLAEARLALWEQTILPMVDHVCDALNYWLTPLFGANLRLQYDTHSISALSVRRDKLWEHVNQASFLTDDEKRTMLGLPVAKRA